MKMPTIHCLIEEGKSVCGKTKGLCMELEHFKKAMKEGFFLGGCNSCIEIVKKMKKTKKKVLGG